MNIIALHGWAQSSQIWFQQPFLHSLNLPGHGGCQLRESEDWLNHLETEILLLAKDKPFILMGWSLGGQLALAIEQRLRDAQHIKGLILVSSTPCFRQQHDWQHGCSNDIWQGFSQAAQQENTKLMSRFFQMMLHGDKLSRQERNQLAIQAINRHLKPSSAALTSGLSLLSTLDSRPSLQSITTPTLIIHGQQDAIVPIQAGEYLAQNIPSSQFHTFKDCGHAPFLSQHSKFNQLLESWCQNISM
ncbi:MAG: alpha/beta fold hydrolase [Ghiorsea sp.]